MENMERRAVDLKISGALLQAAIPGGRCSFVVRGGGQCSQGSLKGLMYCRPHLHKMRGGQHEHVGGSLVGQVLEDEGEEDPQDTDSVGETKLDQPLIADGEADFTSDAELTTARCSVPGCGRIQYSGSVQCERHYHKALRNNIKYRIRAKQAMNGAGEGDWKTVVLSLLLQQREEYVKKMSEIDAVVTAIKGM